MAFELDRTRVDKETRVDKYVRKSHRARRLRVKKRRASFVTTATRRDATRRRAMAVESRRREATATIAAATTRRRDDDGGASDADDGAMWIDCDPGHDDAFALYLATHGARRAGDDATRLVGASTVHGNQSVWKTTGNALRALAWVGATGIVFAGRERGRAARETSGAGDADERRGCAVTFAVGASRPLLRAPRACEEIHGESGLESADATDALEEYELSLDASPWMGMKTRVETLFHPRATTASDAMYDAFVRYVEESRRRRPFVIVATGPLTNVATMILNKRDQIDLLPVECRPVIFCMGGAIGEGNTGARAEFNIQCDPEAAKIVFESGLRVYMIPLEVTHTAIVTPRVLDSLTTGGHFDSGKAGASAHARQIRSLLTFFKDTYENVFDFKTGPPLHDPCAVWAAINFIEGATYDESETEDRFRGLFEFTHERVDVECESRLTYGQTVVDRWGTSDEPKNVYLARSMNVDRFWGAMRDAIQHRLSWMR